MLDNSYYVSGSNFLMTKVEEEAKGGIFLPKGLSTKDGTPYIRGKVVKVGPGKIASSGERAKPIVQEGDEVAILGNDSFDFIIEGKSYILSSEEMIVFGKRTKDTMDEYKIFAIHTLRDD